MVLSKYSLDRNNTVASQFRTHYTPDFFIAEYYGLRNTIFWVIRISPQATVGEPDSNPGQLRPLSGVAQLP
jgi:hypothetical protein